LKVEEGYETGSIELDNIPTTVYILPKKLPYIFPIKWTLSNTKLNEVK